MPVAQAPFPPLEELDFLAVIGDFAEELPRLGIKYHRSGRYLDDDILAVLAETAAARAALAVAGEDMAAVFERKQRPHIFVSAENHVASAASVPSVGSTFGNIFRPVEMTGACSPFSAAA